MSGRDCIMFKKAGFVIWFFLLLSMPLYAQIILPELYHGQTLPLPIDPDSCGTMILTQADLNCKKKAESYMRQGDTSRAAQSLRGISDPWVYHWFTSYMHQIHFKFHSALPEVDWLIYHNNCRNLMISLRNRKKNLEEAIRRIHQWEKDHLTPLKPEKKLPITDK